jgi:two-component system, OmpR family, sensor kinase
MVNRTWRRWQSLPLRWQITAIVAGLIVATLASLGVFLELRLSGYVEATSMTHLHQVADPVIARDTLVSSFRRTNPSAGLTTFDLLLLSHLAGDLAAQVDGPDSFALVAATDGTTIALPSGPTTRAGVSIPQPPIDSAALVRAASDQREVATLTSDTTGRYLVLFVPVLVQEQVIGVAVLGDSLAAGDALLSTFRISLLVGTLIATLLAGFAARMLITRALQPLGQVVAATRRVAAGDWGVRVGGDAPLNELGELARSFDRMVEQLQAAFETQRQFVADASHELRSPLTAVGGMLEMLEINADRGDPAARERIQAGLTREVERMSRLVDDLLTLSRIERDGPVSELVQLDAVVAELRPTLEALAQGHELTVQLAPVRPVLGQRTRLEEIVVNLVDNAAKYTPAGGTITLTVQDEGDSVVLRVCDTGIGIRPDALSRIFERFYRADYSRARATGGFGLGLAIVQAVVTAHRGTVEVASQLDQGSVFTVRLPSVIVESDSNL